LALFLSLLSLFSLLSFFSLLSSLFFLLSLSSLLTLFAVKTTIDDIQYGTCNQSDTGSDNPMHWLGAKMEFAAHAALSNTKEGSKKNIEYHYDAGNAFYKLFLVGRYRLNPVDYP
jgi:hypothetical protein